VQDFSPANIAHLKVRTTFDGIHPPFIKGVRRREELYRGL
jgi:hypothetical protein